MQENLVDSEGDDHHAHHFTQQQAGQTQNSDDSLNKNKVRYLGGFFMLLLIGLNSYFQYSSYVFNELNYAKMGMLSVASFFISSAVGTVLAPWFSRRYFDTYSKKFFVAAVPHVFLIAFGVAASTCYSEKIEEDSLISESEMTITTSMPLYCSSFVMYFLVLVASVVCGLGNALLWVLQGAYITDCTSQTNKGEFFGIFLQLSQVSNVVGPLLSSFLFRRYGTTGYFLVMSLLTILSSFLALLLKEPEKPQSQQEQEMFNGRKESEYDPHTGRDFEHYKALNSKLAERRSSMSVINGATPSATLQNKVDLRKLQSFVSEQYQIKYYFGIFFLNGFFLGFYWSQMGFLAGSKLPESTPGERHQKLGFVYLLMGLIQIFMGQILGASFDRLENKIIFYKRILLVTSLCFFLVLIFYFLNFFAPFYVVSLLFGLGEILIKSFIGGVLSLKFSDFSYESFAVYRLISNLGSGFAMILSSFFTPEVPLVMICSLFLNILFCFQYTSVIHIHLDRPGFGVY